MGSSDLTVLCAGGSDRFEQRCEELALSEGFRTVVVDPSAVAAGIDDDVDVVLVEVTGTPEDSGDGDDDAGNTDRSAPAVTSVIEAVGGTDVSLPVVALAADGVAEAAALAAGVDRTVRFGEGDVEALVSTLRAVADADDGDRPLPGESELLLEEALDALPDVFFVFDLENRMLTWNDRLREVTGHDDAEIRELGPLDFIAPEDRPEAAEAIQRVVADGEASEELRLFTADRRRIDYAFRASLLRDAGGDPVAIAGTGRDVTERNRRVEALQRQTEELRTLNHVNEVIRQVNRALVTATTRSEIERAVCEGLVESERYRLAWIGDFDVTGSRVEPRATAGDDERYLDLRPADDVGPARSAADVIRDGEVVVEPDIAGGDVPGTWREAALGQGFRAAVAVPLGYRSTNYGMLALYADRSGAFDDTERAVLEELGVTIGHAINAAEQRRALTSDTVVECELAVPPPGPPFVAVAAETGATVSLEGAVQRESGMVEYYEVVGDVDAVVAAARERGVETTVVAEYEDRSVVSFVPDEPSAAELVAHHGGVVTAASADGQGGELTVELPEGADVRAVVEAISRANPGTELAAQRTTERTATAGLRFRDDLGDALTDRQREVLETAYYAGFFEWPRGNSAEAVAESLSVSPPTFHEHIRHAERKLVRAFLEHTSSTQSE